MEGIKTLLIAGSLVLVNAPMAVEARVDAGALAGLASLSETVPVCDSDASGSCSSSKKIKLQEDDGSGGDAGGGDASGGDAGGGDGGGGDAGGGDAGGGDAGGGDAGGGDAGGGDAGGGDGGGGDAGDGDGGDTSSSDGE
ncbi:MAG: hypothetical protein IPM23_05590 [Candidatus Melainabacteria bacterium]|nr:hypothetical protein [Candidatus Melainabacteria bacterium]